MEPTTDHSPALRSDSEPETLRDGRRFAAAIEAGEVRLRLTGGVAIALCSPSARHPALARDYSDVDLFGRGRETRAIGELVESVGYEADRRFNALHGDQRLLFWEPVTRRQVDVFLDVAQLCHRIDLRERLESPGATLAPADLLLMKLQVVETNEKDLADMTALLADHPLTDGGEGIDAGYLEALVGDDWGLWRTTTEVAGRLDAYLRDLDGFEQAPLARQRLDELRQRFEAAPKSRRWRLRAKVGERKRWYELPEEHH